MTRRLNVNHLIYNRQVTMHHTREITQVLFEAHYMRGLDWVFLWKACLRVTKFFAYSLMNMREQIYSLVMRLWERNNFPCIELDMLLHVELLEKCNHK